MLHEHTLKIHKIFNPQSIAVVGASDRQETVGYAVLNNLLSLGYEGEVFPINPKRDRILGNKCFASLSAVCKPIDMVVIATPANTVPGIVEDCGKLGITSIVIISSGFSEIGTAGQALEAEIERLRNLYGMRIIGPNCLGVMNPWLSMNASFAGKMPYKGKVGFISQSGALCTSILDWSIMHHIGFSNFVSIGSTLDLEFADLIDYFDHDEKTASIILYIESIKKPTEFIAAARRFTNKKPIFAIKSGRFEEGAAAAASHTGALAGSDDVYDAALERAGIIRIFRIQDLINISQSLSMQKIPAGNKLCIVTNAGGPGVLTTDSLIESGGQLAKLSQTTIDALNACLPPFWSHNNPVDVLGDAQADRYEKAIEICLKEDDADAVLVIFTPQAMSEPVPTARALVRLARRSDKPIFASWMGADYVIEGVRWLLAHDVPSYSAPEPAIDAFAYMMKYGQLNNQLKRIEAQGFTFTEGMSPLKSEEYKQMFATLRAQGRDTLSETEAKDLMLAAGIPVVEAHLASNPDDAAHLADSIGYPVVLKIHSPDITHKTDAGGVLLNLSNADEVRWGFEQIMRSARTYDPEARLNGVAVQKMVKLAGGVELILGMKRDPLWGPAIIFGSGGVNVELLKDKAISLLPLNTIAAKNLMHKTIAFKQLSGYRGQTGGDIEAIANIICRFAKLVESLPEIKEIDINPLWVKGSEIYALDARVII